MRLQVGLRCCRKSRSMGKPAGYHLYTAYRGIPDTVANGDFPPRLKIAGQWENLARDAAGRSGRPGLAAWRRLVLPGVLRNWFPGRAIGQDARQISRPRPRMSADQVVVRLAIGMISLLAIPFLPAFIGFALTSGASFGQ